MRRIVLIVAGLLPAMLVSPGCSLVDRIDPAKKPELVHGLSREELRGRLVQFTRLFTGIMAGAADEMAENTSEPAARRRILVWKMTVITDCREAALGQKARAAFLDTWALCVQLHQFFKSGEGKTFAGKNYELALAAAGEAEREVEEIARDLLRASFTEAEEDINDFAATHPMTGQFGRRSFDRVSEEAGSTAAQLAWVLNIPLAPFRGLNLGIDEVALAVSDFSLVADRFSTIIENLPQDIRWQTQLALYDVEDRQTTHALLADLNDVSAATSSVASSVERLPADFRGAIEDGFRAARETQPELRETLAAADLAIRTAGESTTELRALVEDTRSLLSNLQGASADVARAGDAWTGVLNAYGELASGDESDSEATGTSTTNAETTGSPRNPESPKDTAAQDDEGSGGIEAYGSAAQQIATAADELRALIEELSIFLQAKEWNEALSETSRTADASVTHAANASRGLVDHTILRIAQLAGLIAVIVLATRWLSPRRPKIEKAPR